MTYLDGSFAGPQIALNVSAVAVKTTRLRGRLQAEPCEGTGVVLHSSRCGAGTPYRSPSARLLFVVYDREAPRINGYQMWLISSVIACCAHSYEIYWQPPRMVGR